MKENPLTMEMLLDQLVGLDIIQMAAIPMILLVLLEWLLTIIQKKDYYNGLDTLSATVIGLVNVGISALLKIGIFGIFLFFYNAIPWSIPRVWWAYVLCIISIDPAKSPESWLGALPFPFVSFLIWPTALFRKDTALFSTKLSSKSSIDKSNFLKSDNSSSICMSIFLAI